MGLADDIINGNYTRKSGLANDIISGNYTKRKKKKALDEAKQSALSGARETLSIVGGNSESAKERRKKEFEEVMQQGAYDDVVAKPMSTTIATTADITGNILQGGLSAAEGVSDWARYRYAEIADVVGADKSAKKAREIAKRNDTEDIATSFKHIMQGDFNRSKTDEEINKKDFVNKNSFIKDDTKLFGANARGVFQGVGNTIGYSLMTSYLGGASAGINTATKGGKLAKGAVDLAPIFMSASGGGQTEAYNEAERLGIDISDFQAATYGNLSGLVEAGTESMFGGLGAASDALGVSGALGLGKGALDDKLVNGLSKKFKSTLMKNLVDLGIRGMGEGTEELVSGFFNAAAKKMTYMNESDFKDLLKDQNLLESFISGTLSSIIMQSPANLKATVQGREASTGITKNENKVIEAEVEERIKGKDLTEKEISKVRDEVREDLQNGYISTDTIENTLGKDYDRSNDTYLQESYNERARKQTSFNTDLNEYTNENQRKIVQKAIDSGILNNSKKTHNFVDLVSKIAADKGMDFDFTNNERIKESGFGVEGKTVNGYVNGNTIGLNIESNNALNKTVGHEITHVLEGSDMYQALQDSLKSYVGEETWNRRIKELTETYKNVENADVTKELTADLVGENLFNNEEFVRNLSTKNMNLFEKIFNEIKYLVKIATAGSKEKRDLVKLQKVFESAYRDSKTTKEGTQYSLNDYEEYQNETKAKLQEIRYTVGDDFANNLENQMNEYKEKHPLEYKIREFTKSRDAKNINDEFFKEHDSDYDKNSGTNTPDGRVTVLHLQKGDNLAKVSFTENQEKIWIDELYVKNQKQGYGSEIVNAIKEYANEQGKDVEAFKELSTAKGFWDKTLRSNTKYSLTDNQGRELSKEQQDFFKDSQARNEDGQLMELYHGTTADFNTFERGGGEHGEGYYFTEDYDYADEYSGGDDGRIVTAYLNLKNPLAQNVDLNSESMQKFIKGINEKWGLSEEEIKECFANYNMDWSSDLSSKVAEKMGYGIEDVESTVGFEIDDPEDIGITDYNAYLGAYAWENGLNQLARESGFDGIISRVYNADTEGYEYIAFNSNQIKNVDNSNPTSNPDIRYSLTVQKANTGKDSSGRDLTQEQRDFFKKSKVTDENGNLKVLYHGSQTAGFYDFSPQQGKGHYRFGDNTTVTFLTDSWDAAKSYTPSGEKVDTRRLESVNDAKSWLKGITEDYYIEGTKVYDIDGEQVLEYKNDEDLTRNLKRDMQKEIGNTEAGGIYEVYANITKPYVVKNKDGYAHSWSEVAQDHSPEIKDFYRNLSENDKLAIKDAMGWEDWGMFKDELTKYYTRKYVDGSDPRSMAYLNYGTENAYEYDYGNTMAELGKKLHDLYSPNAEEGSIDIKALSDLHTIAQFDYSEQAIKDRAFRNLTTNDIVNQVLEMNKNGSNYDGIIFENINDIGGWESEYADMNSEEGDTVYVAFNSNQIKGADNRTPTMDSDIRYSLSPSGEMVDSNGEKVTLEASEEGNSGTLMVLHNLGEEKFNGILDLNGIPVPSIAVTNPNIIDHNQFGDGTLIFDKETINPANRLNEVYDRDIWSPTFPQIDYNIKSEDLWAIEKNIYNDYKDDIVSTGLNRFFDTDNLDSKIKTMGIEGTIADAKQSPELMYIFEKTVNPNYQPVIKAKQFNNKYSNEILQNFIDNYNRSEPLNEVRIDDDIRARFREAVQPYYDAEMQKFLEKLKPEQRESGRKLMQENYEADMEKSQNIQDFLFDAYRLQQEGQNSQTIDKYATLDKIKEDVNIADFEKWIDDTLGNLLNNAEKGIYNGKDYITNTGRRTFKQLHNPYNLENLVKALTKGNTKGTQQTIANGFGKIQAQMGNQFKSIADIKGAESQLTTAVDANQVLSNLEDAINQDISDLADRLDGDFWNMDNASNLIQEFASKKNRDENTFRNLLEDYANHGVSSELIERINNDLENLKSIPTDYFEAKPQRAVGLDEIQMAVIPNNWSAETKQRLTDMGIQYTEYDPSIEGDRQRVINQFDDLKFSLSQQNDIAPTRGWDVRGRDIALESAIAPLQEQVQQLQNTIEDLRDNIAPLSEAEAENLPVNENIEPPTRYNLTEDESKRLDFLDRLERENMLTDSLAEERNELMAKEENTPELGEDMTPLQGLTEVRDMDEAARDRSVNAYQYEHPEVKPYFQEEARILKAELKDVIPGERWMTEGRDYLHPTEWHGYKRQASEQVGALLDGDILGTKYTKDQLIAGLDAIIEDHGAENKAVSKRLEFMLDDRLRNGYETIEGYQIEPNQQYLEMLREQSWDKYYEQNPWVENVPAEIEDDVFTVRPQEIAPVRENTQMPQRDIMEMVDNEGIRKSTTRNQPPVPRKQKGMLRQAVDTIKSAVSNRNVEIDNLSKESGNKNIKFYGDMLNGAMGEVNYDINNAQTNNRGETIGKSIKGLFAEAKNKGLGAAFNDFLINYSNIDRYKQGKGSQTPLEVSKRLVRDYAIQHPEFKQWAKDVWNYGKNARQNLVDAGLIDQQTADYLGEIYPHYVPYVSDYENADSYFEGVGELKPKGLKRAKGGAGALLSVEDALARYTYAQKNAVRQNELYKEIVHTLGQVPSFGIDERTDYTDMRDSLFTDRRGNYLTAYEDGKQITTQVSSDLYKELSRTTESNLKELEKKLSLITKPLQGVSKLRKSLITTWNPTFPVTNAIKDIQDALFNSKHTKDMVKNYPGALKELATGKGKEVNQFLALYGSGLTMGEYESDSLNQLTEKIPLLNKIKQINEIVELAPRYAEFKASLQNGESLQEAIYNAREVTTNFNRGGNIAKAMNRNGFTFLNASIQGFDKFIRNFSGENGARGIVQAMAKVVALGIVPALFNHLAYDDDEEYEELKDYIKDNYYLIKNGEGKFIRIPKGRMLSIFGSAARRTLESASGEENAFEGYLENAWNQIGINDPGENNVFAPFIQAFGSKNGTAWYGGDIVPSRLQSEKPENQYDEKTDKFSIWLGGKIGVSPKKINYALDQYLGGIGDVLLPMGTEAASSDAESVGEYAIAPWKDKFTADSVEDSKYSSDFYTVKNSIPHGENATDEEKLQYKYMNGISWELTELYKQKREVQSNPDLTKKEKYQQAKEIQREINEKAKQGLEEYKNIEIFGDYATINGIKYKKGKDGKWTKQRK